MSSGFVFQWSGLLWLLLLALPLAWLLAYARKQRSVLIEAMGGGLSTHRRLRDYLRLLAFVLLVFALARPGYAPRKEAVSQSGRDVVFALDVSQSMLAEDVTPSRLEVSKQAVRDALNRFSNERVGLVVYAGSASIMCPLTYDYDFVRYMLEQVHPRSADFGGTTVQAAVEKAVDQVFMEGRGGVQDLVILTDGGDHGSEMARVAELLNESAVDLLLVGIGNPDEGAPIPVLNEEGMPTLMRTDEGIVYTRLDDASLRELAALSADAVYVSAGRRPFDLGQIYIEYVTGRAMSVVTSEDGIVVYQEAALFFLIPAFVLLLVSEFWGSKGLQLAQVTSMMAVLVCLPEAEALSGSLEDQYATAVGQYKVGAYSDAASLFEEVARSASETSARRDELAVIEFNRGLSLLQLSRAEGAGSAELGMSHAQSAQLAFLASKRYLPSLNRAGLRLEATALWIAELEERLEVEAEKKNALEEAMQRVVERLEALLKAQRALRMKINESDVDRRKPRRQKDMPPPPPIEPPADAATNAPIFSNEQTALKLTAESIFEAMQALDEKIAPSIEGMPSTLSILAEPLKLMAEVPPEQALAVELLLAGNTWPTARAEQLSAEKLLEEILNLLSSPSSDEYEGDDYDDMEYEDFEYLDDAKEGMNSSMLMEGDFAASGEMQELPLPNYSAEEILAEEQGNLQFREQQRAKANASQVEKDY